VARGTAGPESDVDLLIILRKASPNQYERFDQFWNIIRQLEKEAVWNDLCAKGLRPYPSLLILSQEETQQDQFIFLDMIDDGIALTKEINNLK
jgi:predicted nucleotidyltransferase